MSGRVIKVENGYGTASERANSRRCGDCPMRNRYGLCVIRAKVVPRLRPACRYGWKKIQSAMVAKSKAKSAMLAVFAAALAALLTTGCVSAVAHFGANGWGEPYIGTRVALGYASEVPLLWADLPLDVVLDTALLPADLIAMPFTDN